MNIERVKISLIKKNPSNPRDINDGKFEKLVKSIKEFPQMLDIRPIVVNDDMIVLGGNMRLKACVEAGLTEIPIIKASQLTEEQQKEFIIKDNVGYGEWDWELINKDNNWDLDKMTEWGLDVVRLDWNDLDPDAFFQAATEDDNKDVNIKIYLEYTQEDHDKFQELIKKHNGTKEEIILNLLK